MGQIKLCIQEICNLLWEVDEILPWAQFGGPKRFLHSRAELQVSWYVKAAEEKKSLNWTNSCPLVHASSPQLCPAQCTHSIPPFSVPTLGSAVYFLITLMKWNRLLECPSLHRRQSLGAKWPQGPALVQPSCSALFLLFPISVLSGSWVLGELRWAPSQS